MLTMLSRGATLKRKPLIRFQTFRVLMTLFGKTRHCHIINVIIIYTGSEYEVFCNLIGSLPAEY